MQNMCACEMTFRAMIIKERFRNCQRHFFQTPWNESFLNLISWGAVPLYSCDPWSPAWVSGETPSGTSPPVDAQNPTVVVSPETSASGAELPDSYASLARSLSPCTYPRDRPATLYLGWAPFPGTHLSGATTWFSQHWSASGSAWGLQLLQSRDADGHARRLCSAQSVLSLGGQWVHFNLIRDWRDRLIAAKLRVFSTNKVALHDSWETTVLSSVKCNRQRNCVSRLIAEFT